METSREVLMAAFTRQEAMTLPSQPVLVGGL